MKLVRRFRWLVFDMDTLAAVNALATSIAKVIDGVELSLAGRAFPPKLRCILSVQLQTLWLSMRNINVPFSLRSLFARERLLNLPDPFWTS